MIKSVISLFLVFSVSLVLSQSFFPEVNTIYSDKTVPRIDIIIDPANLEQIYANVEIDLEFPATFIYTSGTIIDTLYNVGFRLRGNTSRYSEKKSFKISFNTFENQEFYNMDNMNLNGEHNDPSIIRTKLCWDILREFKVPASRANHIELYINNIYYGLYINVEHIDDRFLENRYGNSDGNLYKCLYPADLNYIDANPDSYKLEFNGQRVYELKTNESTDDYTDLANFIDIINNTPVNEFPEKLEPVFNVNLYLKTLAVEILTGHWDNYAFNKNNFYLYHNTKTNKLDYIDYDMDNTFGIDWFGITWAKRNIYNWSSEWEDRPLTERLLENSEYRQRFSFYINLLMEKSFNYNYMVTKINSIKEMITPYAINDYYRTLDYGFTVDDFNNSYNTALGGHVKEGLKPYISTRNTYAAQQLNSFSVSPLVSIVNFSEFNYSEIFKTEILVEDDGTITGTALYYRLNEGDWQTVNMNDSGISPDTLTNDDVYSASIPNSYITSKIDFYFEITDNNGNKTREPFINNYSVSREIIEIPELYINEIMVSNDSTITDEFGEYEDWIEIYNAQAFDYLLTDIYLTDNLSKPGKWKFPVKNISTSGFILVWCDEADSTGELHTNFKLSKFGESLGLYYKYDGEYIALDTISFLSQETNISYGRKKDGSTPFVFFSIPTPNASNNQSDDYTTVITVFPNPCHDYFQFSASDYVLESAYIIDISGRTYQADFNSSENKVYMQDLQPGIYIINITAKNEEGLEITDRLRVVKN
jgi:spore coat protein H